jgi:hypothetical protein
MKWIIYSLLLVNIGFAVWHWNMPLLNSQSDDMVEQDSDIPRLVLLSEKNAPQASRAGERRCYSLGPFVSKAEGIATRKILAKNEIKANLRNNRDQVNEGYWVLLPPAASREEANKTVSLLREKGEKEFFLVVSGEQLNAISLPSPNRPSAALPRLKNWDSHQWYRVLSYRLPATGWTGPLQKGCWIITCWPG